MSCLIGGEISKHTGSALLHPHLSSLFCLIKSVKMLLVHIKEPSREAAVNTLALVISIEIIQMNSSQQQGSRSLTLSRIVIVISIARMEGMGVLYRGVRARMV
eukprot:scaffold8743_cov174-Ochromonas_danica.AAC.4